MLYEAQVGINTARRNINNLKKKKEISITSDMQMTPPFYGRKHRGTKEPLDKSVRGE